MNHLAKMLVPLAFLTLFSAVSADDWKDESGKGKRQHHERHEFKEEFWDGDCKVERKMEKNGEYKEKRKCKPARHSSHRDERPVVPVRVERVYYPAESVQVPVRSSDRRQPAISVDVRIRP
ncbi:hypothetical protein RBA41_00930 [Massilia sp. CCM 9210]|uniref:hypothetical protein n=1 Tax=Massilia scottii TaxID=3057166 RepID=UPI00279693B9|nr:hypothetical protein [Massilia sp. CCM 9210]MDQ1811858.1 hypothetical protein [Massilia sp. CCM 9210]